MYYMCTFKLILQSFPSIAYQTGKVEVFVGYLGRLIRNSWEIFTTHTENDGEKNVLLNFLKLTFGCFFTIVQKVAIHSYILVYEELCSMNIV